jgi:hypothetical protein
MSALDNGSNGQAANIDFSRLCGSHANVVLTDKEIK